MSKRKSWILLGALGLAFAASAAWAQGHDLALGSDGTIYQVHADTYGNLFPQGTATSPNNQVIALDVTPPSGTMQRMLVPGTDGPDAETLPSVVFADDSQTVFLLWETELNIHPLLQLAGFDGTKWSQVIQVTGNPFALKTSPQFTSTRDSFPSLNPDGTSTTHYRTVLHVVWQELNSANQLESFYTPIVIKDGAYIGWNPIYNLDDFLPPPASATAALSAPQAALAGAPLLQNGPDGRTVVVAYASTLLNRLASIEIDVLPEQLGELAGKTRSHIVDLGKQYNYPTASGALSQMAADTRVQIVSQGSAFQPDIIQSIADQVATQILGSQGQDLLSIAEKTRSHIVDLGATLCGWGLRSPSGVDLAKILEIGETPVPDTGDVPDTVPYQFQFRLSSNLSVPRVGPGTVKLFSSQSGDRLIVSWAQADRLFYRTSQGDGSWSDPKQLIFSSNLDLNKAYQILGQRLGNH
jgi:hypothetical protein